MPTTHTIFRKCTEAEFLDKIQTKVLRVFLLATKSHLYSFSFRFLVFQTHAISYSFFRTSSLRSLKIMPRNLKKKLYVHELLLVYTVNTKSFYLRNSLDSVVDCRGVLHKRGGSIGQRHSSCGDNSLFCLNSCRSSCRSSCHCVDQRSDGGHHRLTNGIDVSVLVEVLRESLQWERAEAPVGRHKIAKGGGERAGSWAGVDIRLGS